MNNKDVKLIAKLADILEANPKAQVQIDNDSWHVMSEDFENVLAESSNFNVETDFYGPGHLYGAAITEALIELLRRRGVTIYANTV